MAQQDEGGRARSPRLQVAIDPASVHSVGPEEMSARASPSWQPSSSQLEEGGGGVATSSGKLAGAGAGAGSGQCIGEASPVGVGIACGCGSLARAASGMVVPTATASSSRSSKSSASRQTSDIRDLWPALQLAEEARIALHALQTRPENTLRIVTWNVWFDELYAQQRQQALLRELLLVAPDVACLQEVLPGFAEAVRRCDEIAAVYDVSPQDVKPYGVMVLARRDLHVTFSEVALQSFMDRKLLSAELGTRWPGLLVTNVHLESLQSQDLRKQQLQRAAKLMKGRSHSVLCGDFNFDDTKTWGDWQRERPVAAPQHLENRVLTQVLPGHADCWRELRPYDPGYTYDGQENPINCRDPGERMRYDRIMACRQGFAPKEVEILGTAVMENVAEWGVRPSDHFGLRVDLEVKEAATPVRQECVAM